MTVEFKLPELGENVESGDVVNVLVKVVDTIDIDQPVLELETDKAVLEVPSDVKGTVKEVLVKEGDQAGPGQVVLIIDDNGSAAPDDSAPAASESEPEAEEASASEAEPEPEPEAEPEPAEESAAPAASSKGTPALIEVKVPELGENVEAGDVIAVLVEVGDTIEVDQAIVELETDKAVLEVPSDIAGVVKELLVKAGDQAGPGQGLLMVETSDAGQSAAPAPKNDAPAKTEEKPAEETDASGREVVVKQQRGFARRGRALERRRADANDGMPARERRQRLAQLFRPREGVELVGALQ
jgi:pyruvate dehydrogenase E2 component (dihydrolipoamide acetyltransferase)